MRVGVSALYRARGGSLTRLVELLEDLDTLGALERDAFILYLSPFTEARLRERVSPAILDRTRIVVLARGPGYVIRRHWTEQAGLARRAGRDGVDVLFGTANIVPYRSRIPRVVLFQNASPYCDGQTFGALPLKAWLRVRAIRWFVEASARRAERVICISEYFRDTLVERTGMDAGRADVVYVPRKTEPVEDAAVRRVVDGLGIAGPYLVMVSHLYPYKHTIELIHGFAAACRANDIADYRLVLAGAGHDPAYFAAVKDAIDRLPDLDGRVLLTGEVPARDIRPLVRGAAGFVFSSTCENLPQSLLEALDMGLPIASSDAGVMPEVCGDAAIYFDPRDPDDVARALGLLMTDPDLRATLSARATAQAARFPRRPDSTRDVLRILAEAAGAPR